MGTRCKPIDMFCASRGATILVTAFLPARSIRERLSYNRAGNRNRWVDVGFDRCAAVGSF
jgi:hypothetical protein